MKWIYLQRNNHSDALALASVLALSSTEYCVIRKSIITQYLIGIKNIRIDFFHGEKDEIVNIDCFKISRWQEKCHYIAQKLSVPIIEPIEPYFGFVQHNKVLENLFADSVVGMFMLYPHVEQNFDLKIFERLAHLFEKSGVSLISAGSMLLPHIKGTQDLREIIGIHELCLLRGKISLIITSEIDFVSVADALNIPVFLVQNNDGFVFDGTQMLDANQIFNYINFNKKSIYGR